MIKCSHLVGELWSTANAPVLLDRSMETGVGPIGEQNFFEPKALALAGLADI